MDIQTFQKVCKDNGLKYEYDLDDTNAAYAYVVEVTRHSQFLIVDAALAI